MKVSPERPSKYLTVPSLLVLVLWSTAPAVPGAESLRLTFAPDPLARFSQPPELRLTCPRPAAAPVVDGSVDDAAWQEAAVIGSLGEQEPRTSVRICADEQALYLAVRCDLRNGQPPKADIHERDGQVWGDDCMEMWIAPDLARATSYQFVVNAANSIYDATKIGSRSKAEHDPRWQHAARIGEDAWTVEMAIPYPAFGLTEWQRHVGFNIGRNGPSLAPTAWNGKYGDPTASVLVLPDAPENRRVGNTPQADSTDARVMTSGEGLRLTFERLQARPGERWITGKLQIAPTREKLSGCKVTAALFRPGESTPLDETTITPSQTDGALDVDLRRHDLAAALLRVTVVELDTVTGCVEAFLSTTRPDEPLATGTRIPVQIDPPEGIDSVTAWPVTFGVPFRAGTLWETGGLRVVDKLGKALPFQCEATGLWAPEGAIKWVRFDAIVNSGNGCIVEVCGTDDVPPRPAQPHPLAVTRNGDAITVDTGAALYVLGPGSSPIREIRREGRTGATSEGARGLYVVDQTGAVARASADGEDVRIEADGPVAACIRFEGPYRTKDGRELARHVTRVELFSGHPVARVTHTFTITQDTNKTWFQDIGWELTTAPGAKPTASFGSAREDWQKHITQVLAPGEAAAMFQDGHYRHAHGVNHFSVDRIPADNQTVRLSEGEECGDWAALTGTSGGLLISCRETARQHPKEFVVAGNRVNLKLHSSRGGQELDFRMPALVKRWDLQNWHEKSTSETRRIPIVERALRNQSNAVGWSRTSFLAIAPLAPEAPAKAAARLSHLSSAQVYAHTDPAWVCASSAMGEIHPEDTTRFPDAERAIDAAFRFWAKRIGQWGDYGFVDYFNGPHLGYRGNYVVQKRYSKAMYTLKVDQWRLYGRSGDRAKRAFIENVARTFMDVDVAQCDGDGRIKGLFHSPPGSDLKPSTPHNLPMPWAGPATLNYSSTTNMNLIAWDYYLTGNRRARDIMFDFAEGAKRHWSPAGAAQNWRSLMMFRTLVQTYAFTWDPVLRAMAERTTDQFYDPQAEIDLTKNRPYTSTTYKTQVDIRAIQDGWDILGGQRYHDMLMKIAERWWVPLLGTWPHRYCNPQARVGSLLYREASRPHVPQVLVTQLRYSASAYDTKEDHTVGCEGAANCTFVFEGLPYAMATLAQSGADKTPTASWIGYEDFGFPSSIIVKKGGEQAVDLFTRSQSQATGASGDIITACPKVEAVNVGTRYGLDVFRVTRSSAGGSTIRLPKDGPGGAYRVTAPANGLHLCYADSRTPMVVYAPEYWRPAPAQAPPIPYYFSLPEGTEDGAIFFEGSARLLGPSGAPWPDATPQHGWIELPADLPGLWSFVPVKNELVSTRNIPPFFAAESPDSYFLPDIPWQRKNPEVYQPPLPQELYVPSVVNKPENQAVHLTGRRYLRLSGGPAHPSGDGLRFLPFKQGTIEFWLKTSWHTCDLQPKGSKALIQLGSEAKHAWSLWHYVKPRTRNATHDFLFSHVLYGHFYSDGLANYTTLRRYRRTVFEPGVWTHVAWVWGNEDGLVPRNPPYSTKVRDDVLIARIFINGKQGSNTGYRWYGNEPAHMPTELYIGRKYESSNIDGLVDELRVSDVQRYSRDFEPSRKSDFELDEHTRALFHFDGDIEGESWECEDPLPVSLEQ
ncbi:MAG: hypothetical protein HN742_30365 [Lentisphaerae bacterium]|nr:hypothetical protein [Lentisphaerota bacterium]MBT7846216.1 hypothetical protein [Lentisphaerota bacterium]